MDDQLISRFQRGERTAFAKLVEHYQRPVIAYLGRLGLSAAEADELAQDAFFRVWKNAAEFDPRRASLPTWLFSIVHNLAVNALRRAHRRGHLPLDAAIDRADESPGPDVMTELERRKHILRNALRRLPVADRSVLALSYFCELDHAAIAKIEACSEAAVKQRLYRARLVLRRLLESEHD
ncbi:MAG: sigma-70 family RNA polymerase sigma factor [Rhodocyclaceae bacterium]|nr:sigma-70 family RNA polymerase sigma factor [Rhodocyclaceae bacterium]